MAVILCDGKVHIITNQITQGWSDETGFGWMDHVPLRTAKHDMNLVTAIARTIDKGITIDGMCILLGHS